MKAFFEVSDIATVLPLQTRFNPVGIQAVSLDEVLGRVLARDFIAQRDLPGFAHAITR